MVSPERTGLCGAYNWMDCKASFEINPTGPNQPVQKGECIDPKMGQWKGVNDFVYKASRQKVDHYFENAAKEKAEREVSQFISFSPSFESELTFLI